MSPIYASKKDYREGGAMSRREDLERPFSSSLYQSINLSIDA
jgi:hypothetical protein